MSKQYLEEKVYNYEQSIEALLFDFVERDEEMALYYLEQVFKAIKQMRHYEEMLELYQQNH